MQKYQTSRTQWKLFLSTSLTLVQGCSLSWLLVCKWFVHANYYYISFEAVGWVPSNDTIHNPRRSEYHYHTHPVYCITKWSTGWPWFSESLFSYLDMKDYHAIGELFYSEFFKGKKRALRVCQQVENSTVTFYVWLNVMINWLAEGEPFPTSYTRGPC